MLHDGKRRSAFPNFSCKNFDSTSSPKKKFAGSIKTFSAMFSTKCSMQQICFLYLLKTYFGYFKCIYFRKTPQRIRAKWRNMTWKMLIILIKGDAAMANVHSGVKSMSIWLKSVDNQSVSQFFNDICAELNDCVRVQQQDQTSSLWWNHVENMNSRWHWNR